MRAFIIVFVLTFLCSCQESKKESVTMKEDVYVLADDNLEGREIATLGERLAAEYLVQRFTDLELLPKGTDGYYQHFSFKPSTNPHEKAAIAEQEKDSLATGMNVVGYIDNKAETTVVIGAHYDHLGYGGAGSLYREGEAIHNGADDNASGVAVLLGLAERLNAPEQPSSNNYLFIAFFR